MQKIFRMGPPWLRPWLEGIKFENLLASLYLDAIFLRKKNLRIQGKIKGKLTNTPPKISRIDNIQSTNIRLKY